MALIAVFGFAAFIALTLLKAYVVMQLWLWFLVPLGLMAVSYAHALGISTLVAALVFKIDTASMGDDNETAAKRLFVGSGSAAIVYVLALVIGAVARGLMAGS